MSYGVYFAVGGMSTDLYHQVHEELAAIGQGEPAGRTYHAGFHVGDSIHVFDVWESMQAFEAFGAHLMPVLAQHGIDPGQPVIGEIELLKAPG